MNWSAKRELWSSNWSLWNLIKSDKEGKRGITMPYVVVRYFLKMSMKSKQKLVCQKTVRQMSEHNMFPSSNIKIQNQGLRALQGETRNWWCLILGPPWCQTGPGWPWQLNSNSGYFGRPQMFLPALDCLTAPLSHLKSDICLALLYNQLRKRY